MTYEELKERQNWTLYQKVDHAVGVIEAFVSHVESQGKSAYVSFSGGKDSTVVLDIARRFVKKDFKAVFCNTGNEFPEIVKFVRARDNVEVIRPKLTIPQVIDMHGFPLISKEQAQYIRECRDTHSDKLRNMRLNGTIRGKGYVAGCISKKWQFLVDEKFCTSEKCCKCLKKDPFRQYEKENNLSPILGIMTEESNLRMNQYIRRGGCNSFSGKIASYPLSIFTDKDIFCYVKEFKLSICNIYNTPGVTQTGCMFCGFGAHIKGDNRFELLYNLYPKAYKLFMSYRNNEITYREALRKIGVHLPDEHKQLTFPYWDKAE